MRMSLACMQFAWNPEQVFQEAASQAHSKTRKEHFIPLSSGHCKNGHIMQQYSRDLQTGCASITHR